ncbi:MAG: DUF4129 domain-containing protein, partial [Candidatus Dormibacteraeota bacterium]|nr:DUF4129 domain-containing protein [Candidatus Dormibacteraeota bacterium]
AGAAAQTACPIGYLAAVSSAESALSATPPDTAAAITLLHQAIAAYPAQSVLGPIVTDLEAAPPRISEASAGLDTIAQTLALPHGSTCTADQRPALSTLHNVYSSSVFANLDHKPAGPNPISQFLAWLASAIRWLLSHLTGTLGSGGTIALGSVLLAAALAFAAWKLRGIVGGRIAAMGVELEPDTTDPNREWDLAAAAARRGDYREAIRRAFRSALLTVANQGRLAVDPSWTTHELLAATVGDAGLLASLAPAAALFDRAWYSGDAVTAADWDQARARCKAIRDLARARTPVPSP